MGRRKRDLPFLEDVEIKDAGSGGKAVARYKEKVVFVPYAVPGDVIDIQVTKRKKAYLEGRVLNYKKYSPLRVEAECKHFGVCGGCKWQMLNYSDQLKFKQKQVEDALSRIGKIDVSSMEGIMANESAYYYRNKLEFTFSNFKWLDDFQKGDDFSQRNMNGLGFHKPGMFDRIVDVQKCHLMAEPANEIKNAVRDFAHENKLSFFDIRKHEGLLRNLIIRNANSGDLMVILVFFEKKEEAISLLMNFLKNSFPQITSLVFIHNPKLNDSISDLDFQVFACKDHIMERMETSDGHMLQYKVGPKSFYQTNSKQAQKLYRKVAEFAELQGNEVVYDLYTGTGTIASFVAHQSKKVVGIEYIEEAIQDAHENAKINNLENLRFFAGDMAKVFTDDFIESEGKPDVLITDPPRAGMHPDVIKTILRILPQRIVYVSCNPATQARDLELLTEKYEVRKIQPVDMFPQTAHVENIVKLERK